MRRLIGLLLVAFPLFAVEPVKITRRTCDVFDPRWSPDSREIFFFSTCGTTTLSGWQTEVMNADGTAARVIPGRGDFRPRPSPDGRRIAFDSFRDGNDHEVYVANRDGSGAVRLTNHPGYDVGPSWSPDGEWIVFSSGAQPLDMSRLHWYGESDLWIMRPDGTGRRRLTSAAGDDVYPHWSPDGKWIAFNSLRDGNPEVYVIAADGTNERRLTRSLARDHVSGFSPDGRHIAFTSDRGGNNDVYVMNGDGSDVTNVTAHAANDADGSWSPDGKWFTFSSRRDGSWNFYRIPSSAALPRPQPPFTPIKATKDVRNVTRHSGSDVFASISPDGRTLVFQSDRDPATPNRDFALYALDLDRGSVVALPHVRSDGRPSWSPDGRRIVFESERSGDIDLYVLELDGLIVRKLVSDSGPQTAARWAPDGRRIAFASGGDVWTVNSDGTDRRNVTAHPAADGAPDWSPDATRLVFASDRDGNFELYTIELASGTVTRLTANEGPDTAPDWSPDGHRIAYASTVGGASEVMVRDLRDGSVTNVSDNPAWDHQPAWGPDGCTLVFTSKRGGDPDLWIVDVCARFATVT